MPQLAALPWRVAFLDQHAPHLPIIRYEGPPRPDRLGATDSPLKGIHDVLEAVVHIVHLKCSAIEVKADPEFKAVGRDVLDSSLVCGQVDGPLQTPVARRAWVTCKQVGGHGSSCVASAMVGILLQVARCLSYLRRYPSALGVECIGG
jgi:hypothetical protein